MRSRTATTIILVALVAGSLMAPGGIASAKKKKSSGPVVVGKDETGDFGTNSANGDNSLAQLGDSLGMDLVEASIGMADKATLNFILKVNSLPPFGGTPEIARYIWSLNVNGEYVELDGKYTNYSRGVCDPTSGQCPPPRDPGMQPFFVRGNCTTDPNANLTTCEELGVVQATFDQSEGTITIPVPLELIGAKPGAKVTAGQSDFTGQAGGPVLAILTAVFSRSDFPADALQMTGTFKVPKK